MQGVGWPVSDSNWRLGPESAGSGSVSHSREIQAGGEFCWVIWEDHLKLRFSSKGQWLVLASRVVNSEFTEFWDLRFDDRSGDSNLARRESSVPEWRSFFGNLDWHKTFPDQPLSAEPILAADALARAGRRGRDCRLPKDRGKRAGHQTRS